MPAPVGTPSGNLTSSVMSFNKTSAADGSGLQTSSTKKETFVNIPTPKSSQTKTGSVTGKIAEDLSARKSAAEPQRASHSSKNSSSNKQRIAADEQHHSAVVDQTASNSHKVSHSSTETPRSGRRRLSEATAGSKTNLNVQKSTEMTLDVKGKRPKQESSSEVNSARQSLSEKQLVSAPGDSRPASRLSVYVIT